MTKKPGHLTLPVLSKSNFLVQTSYIPHANRNSLSTAKSLKTQVWNLLLDLKAKNDHLKNVKNSPLQVEKNHNTILFRLTKTTTSCLIFEFLRWVWYKWLSKYCNFQSQTETVSPIMFWTYLKFHMYKWFHEWQECHNKENMAI